LRAGDFLISDRFAQADIAGLRVGDELALRIDADVFRALEGESDGGGIGAGCNVKIIFEMALRAIIDEVYSTIYFALQNPAILR